MLRFSLAGIPVGVHLSFLIIAVVSPGRRLEEMAVWVAVAFLAVLAHEAGHAFTARHFGAEPVEITLFALGGVTTFAAGGGLSPQRRLVIAAAGSAVGIALGGGVLLLWNAGLFDGSGRLVRQAAYGFIWAALGWGLLNWIPIRPLDGGAILTSFLEIVVPRYALPIAKAVSAVAGVAAAFLLWRMGSMFGAVFVLLITLTGLRTDPGERRPDARPAASGPTAEPVPPATVTGAAAGDAPAAPEPDPVDGTSEQPRFPI